MAHANASSRKPPSRRFVWLVIVVLVLLALVLLQTGAGRGALRVVGISPPDAPYTELAFEAAGRLPSTLPVGSDPPVGISFLLGNETGAAAEIRWQATVGGGAEAPPVTGRVSLEQGQRQDQSATLMIRCLGGRAFIDILVSTQPDPIRHLFDCVPPPSPPSRSRGGR